jgi:transcriptional regulator with XRE-family HTH domain
MIIGERLREWREAKQLSQGDIEKRTRLLGCYLSRVENGHSVPAIETLEKIARALELPMYELFYEGDQLPEVPKLNGVNSDLWGTSGRAGRYLSTLRKALSRRLPDDRKLLLEVTQRLARRKRKRSNPTQVMVEIKDRTS